MYNKEGDGKGKALCENEHCGKRKGVGSPQPRSRHVQRREKGSGQRTSKIEQPARTKRRRPQRRFLDVAMEEIRRVGVGEEDAMDRVR